MTRLTRKLAKFGSNAKIGKLFIKDLLIICYLVGNRFQWNACELHAIQRNDWHVMNDPTQDK